MKIESLIPRTTRRVLLFIGAVVWTYAGVMLLSKGLGMMDVDHEHYLPRLIGSVIGGALFYWVLFNRISKKYVNRILYLEEDSPQIFSFFNLKGYIMMAGMISLGVFLRTSGIVAPFYLSILYVTMGIPLFISSFRFYYSGLCYSSITKKNNNFPR
ncbi:MAG TPA: hypothetical protein VFG54_07305 [Prolixibacteraceae bacterium]|nr:hypothetical protein [Prolixibacteraceae bacterium]